MVCRVFVVRKRAGVIGLVFTYLRQGSVSWFLFFIFYFLYLSPSACASFLIVIALQLGQGNGLLMMVAG